MLKLFGPLKPLFRPNFFKPAAAFKSLFKFNFVSAIRSADNLYSWVDGKRLTGELSATTQRLLKANPKSIRGISRKGYEEFLPASVVQSVVRTAGMPGEGSTTGSVIKAFADLPIVKENVDPKLIERIVDVTNIDPDDPLLERVSPDPQGRWS